MINKAKKILSEISAGELLDKISILEIKLDKIKDKNSLEEINKEYKILKEVKNSNIKSTDKIDLLSKEIKKVNLKLWEVEDKIRIYETKKDFGQEFVDLARRVYFNNDKRAKIKSEINEILGSNIKEIKQYSNY
jgi:predicted  nucleic acid-binding Zn-ribbon protein|tara:strand:- start:210 stop:611 length:402 start_codon:yes stop_codon:yes gene_type:complete